MSQRDDVVAAGVAAVQAGEVAVLSAELGKAFDSGEAIGTGPGFTQADIDAAVQAKVDADALVLAQSQADDKAAFDAAKEVADLALAELQKKFDDLSLKEGSEASVIAGLQSSKAQIEAALAALAGLFPAPVPVPAPEPVP